MLLRPSSRGHLAPPLWAWDRRPARGRAPHLAHLTAARKLNAAVQRLREISSFSWSAETSASPRSHALCVDMEPVHGGLGRCVCSFWLAVAFDILGLLVLLVGVFVNVFFYDLLIYAGAIIIFLSLIWWVFWYSGNIEVPPAELEDDVGLIKKDKGALNSIGGAVRRFSSRLSSGIRNSFRSNGGPSGTRRGRVQRPTDRPPMAPEAKQVSVAMATVTEQEDTPHTAVSSVTGCDVEMPHTTTETGPT